MFHQSFCSLLFQNVNTLLQVLLALTAAVLEILPLFLTGGKTFFDLCRSDFAQVELKFLGFFTNLRETLFTL